MLPDLSPRQGHSRDLPVYSLIDDDWSIYGTIAELLRDFSLSGAEAAALLRESDPGIKTVVSSGYPSSLVMVNSGNCGFDVIPLNLTGDKRTCKADKQTGKKGVMRGFDRSSRLAARVPEKNLEETGRHLILSRRPALNLPNLFLDPRPLDLRRLLQSLLLTARLR